MSHDFLTDWIKGFPTILQEHLIIEGEECVELADFMIERWQEFRARYSVHPPLAKSPLADKIRRLRKYGNEIAIGWSDSGCFWTLHHGKRGAGAMIEGCGLVLHSESNDFEEAVDDFLAELLRLHGPR